VAAIMGREQEKFFEKLELQEKPIRGLLLTLRETLAEAKLLVSSVEALTAKYVPPADQSEAVMVGQVESKPFRYYGL
jgi:hypothetical protein